MEDFRNCQRLNDSVADALEPYILFPEEETADETDGSISEHGRFKLRSASSADRHRRKKTVKAILEYRERLAWIRPRRTTWPKISSGNGEQLREKIAQTNLLSDS